MTKMRYANIIENDFVNGQGVCVSLFTQGCPHKCKGCHNPETWNFNAGIEIAREELITKTIQLITKNGIARNFSVLGGEPLCPQNIENVTYIISKIRKAFPRILIFVWTGYCIEELGAIPLLQDIDYLIDGPYIQEQRNVQLRLRGSTNQRILARSNNYDRRGCNLI